MIAKPDEIVVRPVTPKRWSDLERLFGERGACAGCWCMWPRLEPAAFERGKGAANKRALRRLVTRGPPPGLLAYARTEAIGWCALAPRERYQRLASSRVLAPPDDRPAWAVVCMFVARTHRNRGVTIALLEAAAEHARQRGARVVEGYPYDTRGKRVADAFMWFGSPSAFERAGFREVARRSRSRPIMRRTLRASRTL